jgi:hypothetical protein
MPKFDLKKIVAVKGAYPFYQLTIDNEVDFSDCKTEEEKNDKKEGVLDLYEKTLEKRYKKDMVQIYNTMERVANNEHVSGEKYHELEDRPKNDPYKDYELKHGDLRVYAIKNDVGKIIIFGGFKNSQKKDIRKMRSLKLNYFNSLKNKNEKK